MSKITNDGLTRSGTGCFIAVGLPITQTVGVKRLTQKTVDTSSQQCKHFDFFSRIRLFTANFVGTRAILLRQLVFLFEIMLKFMKFAVDYANAFANCYDTIRYGNIGRATGA